MLEGSWKNAVITILDDDDLTPEVDLGCNFSNLVIEVPTITNAEVSVEVAEKTGGTFRDLHITDNADGGNNKVKSASGTGAFTWLLPLAQFRFIKIKTSAGQGEDRTFRVRGINN